MTPRTSLLVLSVLAVAQATASCESGIVVSGGGAGAPGSGGSASQGGGGDAFTSTGGNGSTTTGGQGGERDDWCKPTPADGRLNGDMVSSCCDDVPCWGECIDTPRGTKCDCFGIEGGCPLDSGLVCCLQGMDCRNPDECPQTF